MHAKQFTLKNGLEVIIKSAPQFQTVGVSVGIKYGSIDENQKVSGAAHYLEHMLFKGTKKRTWKMIWEEGRKYGMMQNAFTDKESTQYIIGAYKGYLNRALDLLSDMVRNSVFPKDEFEKAREPIINENLIRDDTPEYIFYDFLPKILYQKHPARMPIGGNEATIKRTKIGDILNIYDNYYSPENMIVAVYGGVSTTKAFDMVKRYFDDFEKKSKKLNRWVSNEKQFKKELVISKKGIKQTRLGIGFKSSGFKTSNMHEYLSMLVIREILSKRLFDEVREKRGLSYDPYASYSLYNTFGFIGAAAGIEPAKLAETKEVVLKEFEKLQNGEVPKSEVESRKKVLSIKYTINTEDTLGMAVNMADAYSTFGDPKIPIELPKMIKKVNLDDVRKYSAKYIDVDKYGMVVLKPKK